MAKNEKHTCDHCGKDFDELITREGFVMTYFVEWVCQDCFVELEGMDFDEYPGGDYERQVQIEKGH